MRHGGQMGSDQLREGHDAPHVVARCELRHDASVHPVHRNLRVQRVRKQPALAVVERKPRFVARCLDAENEHGSMIGVFAPVTASCYTCRLSPVTQESVR